MSQATAVISRTYIERVMFIGNPSPDKIEYVKKLGFTRREGQWTRYNTAQQHVEQSALEQTVKA